MKSINKKIIVTILVIIEIMLINITYKSYSNRIIDEKEIENKRIAIKVDNGNNEYEDREEFPGRGYVINEELTECLDIEGKEIENIKLDSNGENITITGRYTSYCTLYYYLPESREYDYIGDYQVFIAPKTGNYKIELWGASGGGENGGKGAYTKGTIHLSKNEKIYVYVGENPIYINQNCYYYNPNSSFNGSLIGSCVGGGGATDVRLNISSTGNWDNFDSLKSRIMVAAGGGGYFNYYGGTGGYGGALTGGDASGGDVIGIVTPGKGATQKEYTFGRFYKRESGTVCIPGNGYYSGEKGYDANSGGGSSFISGYEGCIAIDSTSTEDNVIPKTECGVNSPNLECSKHYSGKVFTDTQMIAGNSQMPTHNGEGTMEGNTGNGYAKITFVN